MAAPAWQSTGSQYAPGAPNTTHTVSAPAGVTANDILVASIYIDTSATLSGLPSGFSHAPGSPIAASDNSHSLNIVWKRAGGSEPSTYDFDTSGNVSVSASILRYSGAITSGDPFDTPGGGDTEAAASPGGVFTSPSVDITTLGADRMLIWSSSNIGGGNWTPPSAGGTWNERFDENDQNHTLADKTQAAAGNTGSVTGTIDNTDMMTAWIGALKPPVSAPAFGTVGTHYTGTNTSHNIDVPDSVASGDIIVASIFVDGYTFTLSGLPSGFEHAPGSPVINNADGGAGSHSLNIVWKRASGGDTGSYTFTTSGSTYVAGSVMRYTGAAASGNPFEAADTNYAPGVPAGVEDSPEVSLTTRGADRLLLFSACNWGGGVWTQPSVGGTWNERFGTGEGDQVHTLSDKVQTAAGATGNISANCNSAGVEKMSAWIGALCNTTPLTLQAPTFVNSYSFGDADWFTNTTPKSVNVTTQAGDIVVVYGAAENQLATLGTPSGNGITFNLEAYAIPGGDDLSPAWIWVGTDSVGGTNWSLSNTVSGTGNKRWGMGCLVFRNSVGVGNRYWGNGFAGTPSLGLNTTQDNSAIVVISSDWQANLGPGTWRTVNSITPTNGNGLERDSHDDATAYTAYGAYYSNAGTIGAKTVGLSAPGSQDWSIAAVEIYGYEPEEQPVVAWLTA